MKKRLLLFLAWSMMLPSILAAQVFRGTIQGRITDPSGGAVPGATITATNVNTNVLTKATSNPDGNYMIQFLEEGDYTVAVEQTGFKHLVRPGIRVSLDSRVSLDFQLQLGAVSQSVTVTGAAPLLNMATAESGQVIQNAYVNTVDFSFNRNVQALAYLAPGVSVNGVLGGTYTAGTTSELWVGGGMGGMIGTYGGVSFLVDGFPATTRDDQPSFYPTLDETQEVKVTTGLFDASLGATNGGVVNITTKGGTNTPHGTLFFNNNPVDLQSNGWDNNKYGVPRLPYGFWQWGFQLGGPVVIPKLYNGRNRTFFTLSGEQDHDPRGLSTTMRVPTALERQGNFSQTLSSSGTPVVIYDPATTVVNSDGSVTRQAFANSIIPASRIDNTGQAVLNLYPQPNQNVAPQVGVVNWAPQHGQYIVAQKNYSGRFDEYISEHNRLFTRLGFMGRQSNSIDAEFYPGYTGKNIGHSDEHWWNWGLDDVETFSPSMVGTFRVGVQELEVPSYAGGAHLSPALVDIPSQILGHQYSPGFPTFTISSDGLGTMGSSNSFTREYAYIVNADFSKIHGNHDTRWGADYRIDRHDGWSASAASYGSFTFDTTFTEANPYLPATATYSGAGMADLLLGLPTSGSLAIPVGHDWQNWVADGWVQDDWRVKPKLTLNFGLRYDLEAPTTERHNEQVYGFNPNAALPVQVPGLTLKGGLLLSGINGNPRTGGNWDKNNLGPRFGFAYHALHNTVVRGGFGIFYGLQEYNAEQYNYGIDPGTWASSTPFVGTTDNGATPYNTLGNPFPTGLTLPLGNTQGLLTDVGNSISFWSPQHLNPYTEQWQLSIQQQLPSATVVEVQYHGEHSLKESESFNLNELPDQYLALGSAVNNKVTNPFLGYLPTTSTLGQGATISQKQLLLAYPQFGTVTEEGVPTGMTDYNAMDVQVEKRLTHGFTSLTVFTWSKMMQNNTTSLVNVRHYRCISAYDQPDFFREVITYKLPTSYFPNLNQVPRRLMQTVASRWELASYWMGKSGEPLSVTQANGRPLRTAQVAYHGPISQRLGETVVNGQITDPYFNIHAFQALPSPYVVSPEPPYLSELRAPAWRDLNVSLYKYFPISEKAQLQFSLEFDQATNAPLFLAPGTNMSKPVHLRRNPG